MKKLLLALMLLPVLAYGQVPIHSYPPRDTVDSNSQFLGIEIIPGGWHTYRFPFSAFVTAVGDSVGGKPSGGVGAIQLSGVDTFSSGSLFWFPNKFVFGLGDGRIYLTSDTTGKFTTIGIDAGKDSLKGDVYLKKLAGNGVGSVGIDNTGKLTFNSGAISKNHLFNETTTTNPLNVICNTVNGAYHISGNVNVISSSGGHVVFSVTWTDQNGNFQNININSIATSVTGSGASTMAQVGDYQIPTFEIISQVGQPIEIFVTVTGTINYDVACTIINLN